MVITRDELEELDPKKTQAIEIQDFVDLDEIDPIYFDHPYYLGPDKGAEKAYALLVKAMGDANKVAVARFVLRNRENLAAIRPMGKVLTMATMRFADEVVSPDELGEDVIPEDGQQAGQARGRDGRAADRVAERRVRPRQVPRRVPRGAPGPDRAQGARARRSSRPSPRSRSRPRRPTSWPRSRRASPPSRASRWPPAPSATAPPSATRGRSALARQVRVEVRIRLEDPEQVAIAKQGQSREVDVDGHRLELTNLDKVLWPEVGFTKGEVIDYYARIADDDPAPPPRPPADPEALPERRRGRSSFYEKRCPGAPARLGRRPRRSGAGETRARSTTASATTARP